MNAKNILLNVIALCIFFLFITTACKEQVKNDGYVVSGTINGFENGWVKLMESSGGRDKIQAKDSCQIIDGKFEFKGKMESPDMVDVVLNDSLSGRLFLENSPIQIEVDLNEIEGGWRFEPKVTGSKFHDIYSKVDSDIMKIFDKEKYLPLTEVREKYTAARKSGDQAQIDAAMEKMNKLRPLSEERNKEYTSAKYNYVKANPNSPVAVYILSYQFSEGRMSNDELKEYYNLFEGDAKSTYFYKGYMTKVYTDVFERLGVDSIAPDFTLKTVDGDDLTLSNVEGRVKLLDFWASWCVPCRASFPHLKELYEKYGADGFEIVGVGTADKEQKWRDAIEEDQTPWIHIFDPGEETERRAAYGEVAKLYNVPFLPTTFLMDNEQKIILRNPSKEDLDAKLKEFFGY